MQNLNCPNCQQPMSYETIHDITDPNNRILESEFYMCATKDCPVAALQVIPYDSETPNIYQNKPLS